MSDVGGLSGATKYVAPSLLLYVAVFTYFPSGVSPQLLHTAPHTAYSINDTRESVGLCFGMLKITNSTIYFLPFEQ